MRPMLKTFSATRLLKKKSNLTYLLNHFAITPTLTPVGDLMLKDGH